MLPSKSNQQIMAKICRVTQCQGNYTNDKQM